MIVEIFFLIFQLIFNFIMTYQHIQNSLIIDLDIFSQIAVFLLTISLNILDGFLYRLEMGKIRAIYNSHKAINFSLVTIALVFGFWQIILGVILLIVMFYPNSLKS